MLTHKQGLLGVLVLVCSLSAPCQPQGLQVTAENPTASPMVHAPVSFGVPFHKGPNPLYDTEQSGLAVFDAQGTPVPCQFRVLSRWGGLREDGSKPLKWVLVTILADLPPHGSATYWLRPGTRPAGQLTVASTPGAFTVTTAPGTTFVIDRYYFSLFRSVTVNGVPVVTPPGGNLAVVDCGSATVYPCVTESAVEDSGPLRAVIRQRGTLGSLGFTCRWTFHSGRSEATVDFRLENPGAYGSFFGVTPAHRYIDSLSLNLPVAGGSSVTSTVATRTPGTQTYELTQDCIPLAVNEVGVLDNFRFAEKIGTSTVASGLRYDGALDVSGPAGGVTVAVDRFWQSFPKGLKVQAGVVKVGLWPEWGHGPEYRGQYATPWSSAPIDPFSAQNYRIEGGRWKSHRLVFEFHTGSRTAAQVTAAAERANRPAMGRPLPWWTKHTRATGLFWCEKRPWASPSLQRSERMSDMIADDAAADDQGPIEGGRIGLHAWRNIGGLYGGKQFFGWDTYGDLWWGDGYSNLHYDWPLLVLLQWYRGGSYEFFDVGRDMAVFRRDYGQNHTTDQTEPWRGAAFYEKGYWHGNEYAGDEAHTWVHGLLLHYVMTGDEGSREAAIEAKDYLIRNTPRNWAGVYDARVPGWCIDNLVDLYGYLGLSECLAEAEAGVRRFKQLEVQHGSQGYVLDPMTAYPGNPALGYPANPAFTQPWCHAIFFVAAARYMMISEDYSDADVLDRMRAWFKNSVIVRLSGPLTSMTMPFAYHRWAPGYTNGHNVHHLWAFSEALAYSAALFNSAEDADLATELFDVMTRFHQEAPGSVVDFFDTSAWSVIAMRMMMYPSSESKIIANILHWSLATPFVMTWRWGVY